MICSSTSLHLLSSSQHTGIGKVGGGERAKREPMGGGELQSSEKVKDVRLLA